MLQPSKELKVSIGLKIQGLIEAPPPSLNPIALVSHTVA